MTTVALTDYDVILINSSAGKDSQAMLDFVAELAKAQGVLDRVVVVHADLGRMEWKGVRDLAEEQAAHYGFRFEVVSRPQGDLLSHVRQRKLWPSSTARYCTSDHKRGQVSRVLTKLTDEKRAAGHVGPVRILNCLGIRAQESAARAKKIEFTRDARATNGRRTVDTWYPIFGWTEAEVWTRIAQAGTRHHPAYDLGMPRLSCVFCVFAPRSALLVAARENPDLFAEYAAVEKEIGHDFRKGFKLGDLALALERGETVEQVEGWSCA